MILHFIHIFQSNIQLTEILAIRNNVTYRVKPSIQKSIIQKGRLLHLIDNFFKGILWKILLFILKQVCIIAQHQRKEYPPPHIQKRLLLLLSLHISYAAGRAAAANTQNTNA